MSDLLTEAESKALHVGAELWGVALPGRPRLSATPVEYILPIHQVWWRGSEDAEACLQVIELKKNDLWSTSYLISTQFLIVDRPPHIDRCIPYPTRLLALAEVSYVIRDRIYEGFKDRPELMDTVVGWLEGVMHDAYTNH